ncbi:hypothetical protein FE257_004115 [Aspergillus nanangensis]|uniref:Uncharacterized protein n=1 Tax=Aspergillus nanangensis TaxID=2582783 RepID=A0AAD4CAW9_ASPNN|nr:hypothetical protein FE257_004115 [Aspergillus nanangensis]
MGLRPNVCVQCDECRPLDLQRAPGVGIDLTTAYIAASIRFRNGTSRPLGVINGTSDYRAAMKLVVEQRAAATDISFLPYIQSLRSAHAHSKSWLWWVPNIWPDQAAEALIPDSIPIPDHVTAISSMLAILKSSVLDQLDPPLKYNNIVLSMPDISDRQGEYADQFEISGYLAGLQPFRCWAASRDALYYNGVEDWTGPGNKPPPHIDFFYPRNILTVSYNPNLTLGADKVDKVIGYWDEVRRLLVDRIRDAPLDYIQLIGSHAYDRGLIQALRDVIGSRDNIDPAVLDRYTQDNASKQNKEEALFASADGAAKVARYGMLGGLEGCFNPYHCPDDDDYEEFEGKDWWSILGVPHTMLFP